MFVDGPRPMAGGARDDRREGGWEYLAMPGEFSERTVFDRSDGETWTVKPGDLLYPECFDRAALDQLLFDLGEAQFNAQILQQPSPPGGALIELKYFKRYETLPSRYEAIVLSWDRYAFAPPYGAISRLR
jgi:hypothetical protein